MASGVPVQHLVKQKVFCALREWDWCGADAHSVHDVCTHTGAFTAPNTASAHSPPLSLSVFVSKV